MSLFDQLGDSCVVRGGASKSVAPIVIIRMVAPPVEQKPKPGRTPRPRTPVGKDDPKSRIVKTKTGQTFVSHYTGARTRNYEDKLRAAAIDAMRGKPILDGYLSVTTFTYFEIPASWPRWKREKALAGEIRPDVKPDTANIAKTLDALNPYRDKKTGIMVQVCWTDDSIVVDERTIKLYAKRNPGIIVEIRRAEAPPEPWSE